MKQAYAMRLLALLIPVVFASVASARADDCVNTAINNPAFSSDYLAGAKPCPPPVGPAQRPLAPAKSAKSVTQPKTAVATAKPVVDPDHATVTTTSNGTLLKSGDTTVCISGSVSVEVATGSSHFGRRPSMRNDSSEPSCNQ